MAIAATEEKNYNKLSFLFLWRSRIPGGHKDFFSLSEILICLSFPLLCSSLLDKG